MCDAVKCTQVFLIEKDDTLVHTLRQKFPHYTVIHQDILDVDIHQLYTGRPLVLYGNLPYNISVAIVKKLCAYAQLIKDMTFLVQKEVGDRLVATKGKDYSPLSIAIQLYFEVSVIRTVSPEAFIPRPKVYSSLIKLVPKDNNLVALINDIGFFHRILSLAFSQRRKKIRNTLGKKYILIPHMNPDLRPEQIPLHEWITLANSLKLI
jgi:16S rRNA (adenine1518-N6/adenine1519-N6)-dimethyltransferase